LFSRSEIGLGTLYPRHLDVMQDYVSAMTLYRLSPSEGGLKERVLVLDWVGTDGLPDPFRLVWKASNGNLVARIGKGLFRISLGNYRANWFHDLDCRLLNWSGGEMDAAVSCSDGQDRRMTVPGSGLLMIDDDRYQRVFPMVASPEDVYVGEEPAGAEGVDPNAAEGGETIQ
jgi:hypothetical protein